MALVVPRRCRTTSAPFVECEPSYQTADRICANLLRKLEASSFKEDSLQARFFQIETVRVAASRLTPLAVADIKIFSYNETLADGPTATESGGIGTMRKQHILLSAAAATLFFASPIFVSPSAAQSPIKIGFPMVQSGPASLVGIPTTAGAQMAVDEINAAGGVLGRKLQLIIRDTKGTADEAVRVSRELILRDNVDFLVGTSTSAEGPAVSTIAKENKIVLLAAIPGVDSLTAPQNLHPYIFRTSIPTRAEGRAAAEIFAKWPDVKRVATISPDYGYGQDLTREFIAHLKKLKPDIEIVDQQWPKFGEREFSPFINAQMAKKPDAVFASVWGGDFVTFAKQAKQLGYFDMVKNNVLAVGGGASVENTRAMNQDFPVGIWGNSFDVVKWDNGTAAHSDWMARLKKYTKDEYPSSWPTMGYIPVIFLAEAIKRAGSTDSDKVSAALQGLSVETPIGKLTMRAKDHEVGRGNFWGKVDKVSGVPFPIMVTPTYLDPAPLMD